MANQTARTLKVTDTTSSANLIVVNWDNVSHYIQYQGHVAIYLANGTWITVQETGFDIDAQIARFKNF